MKTNPASKGKNEDCRALAHTSRGRSVRRTEHAFRGRVARLARAVAGGRDYFYGASAKLCQTPWTCQSKEPGGASQMSGF